MHAQIVLARSKKPYFVLSMKTYSHILSKYIEIFSLFTYVTLHPQDEVPYYKKKPLGESITDKHKDIPLAGKS